MTVPQKFVLLVKGKGEGCDYSPAGCNRNWYIFQAKDLEDAKALVPHVLMSSFSGDLHDPDNSIELEEDIVSCEDAEHCFEDLESVILFASSQHITLSFDFYFNKEAEKTIDELELQEYRRLRAKYGDK